MGWQSAAKHYKVSQSVARFLVKIVDANLKEAGIDSWSINGPRPSMFTKNDDRLVGELIEKEHAESGKAKVRPGFWEKINKEHFAGRGVTTRALQERHYKQIESEKKRLSSDDAKELIVPDGIDTSKLPSGWEDIVRAELKACGMGRNGDAAGEPPTRKRMGYQRTAKHYRVAESEAKLLE